MAKRKTAAQNDYERYKNRDYGVYTKPKTAAEADYQRYRVNNDAKDREQINIDYVKDFQERLSNAYKEYQSKFGNNQYNAQSSYQSFLDKYNKEFDEDSYQKYAKALKELMQAGTISVQDQGRMLKDTLYMPDLTKSVKGMSDYMSQFKDEDEFNKSGAKYALKYGGLSDNELKKETDKVISAYKNGTSEERKALKDEYDWVLNNTFGDVGRNIRQTKLQENETRQKEILKELQYYIINEDNLSYEERTKYIELQREREQLEAENNIYKRGYAAVKDKYSKYESDPNFSLYSKQRKFDNKYINQEEIKNQLNPENWHTDFDGKTYDQYGNEVTEEYLAELKAQIALPSDKLGIWLGASDDDRTQALAATDNTPGSYSSVLNEGGKKYWKFLKDDEIDMYYYLLNTKGQQVALDYLDDMSVELGRRNQENEYIEYQNKNWLEKVLYNVASVPANVLGGMIAGIDDTITMLSNKDVNPYSQTHAASNFASMVRGDTADWINSWAKWNNGKPIKILGILDLGQAYQSIMSALDSKFGAMFFGNVGSMATGLDYAKAASYGYGFSMGMGAVSGEARRLYEAGASSGQILSGALLNGVAEELFETLSLDKVLSMKDARMPREHFYNVLLQAGIEGSEEVATEIANIVTDMSIMGAQSGVMQSYYAYREQGISEGTASIYALWDAGIDIAEAFMGGAISGGVGGVGGAVTSSVRYNTEFRNQATQALKTDNARAVFDTAEKAGIKYSKAEQKVKDYIENNKGRAGAVSATASVLKKTEQARIRENIADMQRALMDEGISEKRAKKIAQTLSYAVERKRQADQRYNYNRSVVDMPVEDYLDEEDDKILKNDKDLALKVLKAAWSGSISDRNAEYMFRQSGDKALANYYENARVASAAPKLSFEGSVDGQNTSFTYDHIDGDTLYVKAADGKVIKADDVQTTNRNAIQVMQDSVLFGEDGAKAYINGYDGQDAAEYRQMFTNLYNQAKNGVDAETLINEAVANGTPEKIARLAAYAGEDAHNAIQSQDEEQIRKYLDKSEAEKILENIKQAAKGQETDIERENRAALKGVKEDLKKVFTNKRVEIRDADIGSLSQEDQGQLAAVTMMLTALGRKVVIMSSTDSSGQTTMMSGNNAGFDRTNNVYYLNTAPQHNAYLNVGFHETVHDLKKNQPKVYERIRALLEQYCQKNNIDYKADQDVEINKAKITYYSKDRTEEDYRELGIEEWVANTATGIVANPDTFTQFADKFMTEEQKKTFLDFLDMLLEKIKKAFDMITTELGWRQAQAIKDDMDLVQQLRDLMFEGYENIKNETAKKAKGNKVIRFSRLSKTFVEDNGVDVNANKTKAVTMEPVAQLTGEEFEQDETGSKLSTKVIAYYDSIGNIAHNDPLGDIALTLPGVESDIFHGVGRKKAAAFMAVPQVIENGQIVDVQYNWKSRDYDTVVLSAPITIAGDEYQMAVVVMKSELSDRLYLHEVLLYENKSATVDRITRSGAVADDTADRSQPTSAGPSANEEKSPHIFSLLHDLAERKRSLKTLSESGIEIDNTGAAVPMMFSTRTWGHSEEELQKMVDSLVAAGFDEEYSKGWVADIDSVYSLVMENQKALSYENDERYSWLKKNSEYSQGSIDFNNNCPKRVEFTALFDRLLKEFPNSVLTDQDFETIRGILKKNGIAVTCGICFVEDRRQALGTVAQAFIDMLKDGTLAPMFKSEIKGDTYIPTQYDLITYEGYYNLWKNHEGIYKAFKKYNNHRGMASIRLVEGIGEYNNQIRKWSDRTIKSKNNKGGLRIWSTSDADPRTMLDVMQIVNDAAAKGLQIQGYTKKSWFAKLVKNTGIRLLRSHIPSGVGYETVNGREVLTVDNVEGINTKDLYYEDVTDNPYIGNNIIGINDHQIRLAMLDPKFDQIIPFHSNQKKSVLEKKGIGHYNNYKLEQTEKKGYYSNGEGEVGKQVNIYTQVIKEFEKRGQPIQNKYDFVNAYLQVCKEKDLCPVFCRFLDKNESGDYIYTEGYHKFLVDYKMFDKEGNYIPQVAVKPQFDAAFATEVLKRYVRFDEAVNKAVAPEVREDVYNQVKDAMQDKLRFSANTDSMGNQLTEEQSEYFKDSKIRDENGNLKVLYHGTNAEFNIFDQVTFGENGDTAEGFGIYLTDSKEVADSYGGRIIEAYANVTRPASKNAKTIKRNELVKLIKATCEHEAQSMLDDYGSIEEALKDTWISNYTYTYDKPINAAYNQVAADILRMNDNDMDIIQEVMAGMAIRDYAKAYEFYPLLTETIGIDGFETTWQDSRDPNNPAHIVVAFNSNQVKNTDNLNPSENPDIRYSSNYDRIDKGLLSKREWALFYKAVGELKQGVRAEELTANGDLIISFGENAENIVAICTGTYDNPGILRLYKINLEFENEIEDIRDVIKRFEKTFSTEENETVHEFIRQGIVGSYHSNSSESTDEIRRSERSYDNGKTGRENAEIGRTFRDRRGDSESNRDLLDNNNGLLFSSNNDIDASSLNNSDQQNYETLKQTIGDQYRLTVGKQMTMPAAEKIARDVTRRVSSKADQAELANRLKALFDKAAKQGKDLDTDSFMDEGTKILRDVLEQSATFDSIRYKADEPLRKYLRGTGIALNELQQGEARYLFESVANYRRALFGMANITNKGIPLDVAWAELNRMNPALFPSDVNDGDMVHYFYDAVKGLTKANYYVNEYGFDLDGAAAYEFAQVVGDYTENKRIKTFVQQLRTYGKRYLDNEMKEIRKTRREKMAIQSRLYEEQRKRNVSLKVEISNLERQLSGEAQDIQRDITFLQSRLKNVQPGVDEFALREQIADLEQDKANLEERYRAEIKSKTDELQQGQEELEKIGREYVKAGSTSATLALDARKAAIGTRSAVKLKAQKEAQEIRTLQNNIRKKSSNLMGRLISGTDTKHVPENLREAVTGFLQAVDLGWNQGTYAAEKWLSDLNVLADKMAAANETNGSFQVDSMIIDQLREMAARITERLSLAGKNLRTMSIAELNQLDDALSLVNAAIYNSDRLLADDRKQRASAVAERSITEMGKKKQRKHTKDLLGRVGNFFTLDQLDSFSYAERIGGPFKDVIFRNLRKAFDKKVQLVQQGIDAYHKAASVFGSTEKSILSKIRSMSGNNAQTKTFDLESGKKIMLNTAQIMELYLLNERDQARIHLYNGGITVEEYKAKDGTVKKQEFIKVTEDDIDKIIGTLTKEQKKFANELQKYASSNMSEWGNDVSLTLWGVKKFTEQNYWPITVDDNTTDAVSQDKKNGNVGLYHLKNIGMSKAVNPKANNALVLGDVIDTFIRHVDEMTSYAAYTIPLDDAMKWYNYKNGNQTVQRSIESLMGKGGKAWFTDFIRALNNAQDMSGGMDFADTMIRNAKVAAIAANLRVVIQQPSAFARAVEAIDSKYLLNVSNLNVKQGAKEAQEHSSIARWKNWGFRDVNVGGDLRSLMVGDNAFLERVREKASVLAGVADDATWGALWNACKAEIEDKRKDLEIGSEEYWQAISDRFSEVIDRTQVVDSPFHRSKAMRSKNALWKMYTAFMSEPTKTYNMFYKTISNAYQGNWSAETRKAVARATFAFAAATILNSVLAAIVDVGRDTDDEDWWEKYLKNMGKNMLDGFNPLNLIPIGKDIVSIFDGYEASRMDLDAVSDLIKQFKRAGATLSGEKDYNTWKIRYDSVMALSKITGIPAGNAWRAINSLLNLAGVDVSVFKGTWNNTNAKAVAEDMYSYFAKGDIAGFQRVFDKYVEDEVSKMVEEDTKTLEETGQHKYDSTESMQNKATKAVLNKLAQQLADNEEQIAEAYLAKTIGDGSEVMRIRNEYIAKGIPEEVFDKAVNLYGSSMNVQPEGVNELNSKLYSYDDLYAAIESGDLEDIGYIYDEMIEDSQAVNPEEYISNKAVKEFRDKYYEYVGSGQTAKASQLENTLEQAFGLTSEDLASYKTGYQKYAFVQKAGAGTDDITTAAITTYTTNLKGLGITESTWYNVWKFKNTNYADVDKNGKSIDGSLRDKIFRYIDSLPLSPAQKSALAKECGYGESSIQKNKLW